MRIDLNLATRLHYNRIAMRKGLWLLTALLMLVLVLFAARLIGQQSEVNRLQRDVARLDQQLGVGQSSAVVEKDLSVQKQQISALNGIIERKSSNSWIGLFDAIETVIPDGVSLTKLSLDPKGDQLKLDGRATNFAAIRLLLENLDRSQQFREALLLSHSESIFGDRARGLQFTLSAKLVRP